jgi:hypothetical protein
VDAAAKMRLDAAATLLELHSQSSTTSMRRPCAKKEKAPGVLKTAGALI